MQGVGFDPDRLKVRSIGSSERTVHLTFREVSPSSKEDWLRRGTQGGAREEAIETWLDDRDCPAGRLVRYKLVARWRDLARPSTAARTPVSSMSRISKISTSSSTGRTNSASSSKRRTKLRPSTCQVVSAFSHRGGRGRLLGVGYLLSDGRDVYGNAASTFDGTHEIMPG